MASSSLAPTPPPQTRDLSRRGISPEPRFDPLTFKDQEFCAYAIETIENTDLSVFTRLPKLFCPRLVRQFYESLKATCDLSSGEWSGEFTIDGTVYHFTSYDIAKALWIKDYKPLPYDEHSELDMRIALTYREPPTNTRQVLRESHFHQDFWVVHKFMRACASPFTHDNEVPQYLFKYWHGMYTKRVIDIPALMLENMLISRDGGRVTLAPHSLAMPRSIMAILKGLKYKFSKAEPREEVVEVFNYERYKKSLSTLAVGANLKNPVRRRGNQGGRARRQEEGNVEVEQGRDQGQVPEGEGHTNMGTGAGGQYANQDHHEQMMAMMQGFGTTLQGFGTQMGNMHGLMQGMNSSMQEGFGRYDTRLQGLETTMGMMQAQVDDNTYETHQTYLMQRLSISRQYNEDEANAIFSEAERSAPPRPSPMRTNQRRRRRHRINDDEEQEDTME